MKTFDILNLDFIISNTGLQRIGRFEYVAKWQRLNSGIFVLKEKIYYFINILAIVGKKGKR